MTPSPTAGLVVHVGPPVHDVMVPPPAAGREVHDPAHTSTIATTVIDPAPMTIASSLRLRSFMVLSAAGTAAGKTLRSRAASRPDATRSATIHHDRQLVRSFARVQSIDHRASVICTMT
jgi:hypothetical protein